MIWLQIINEMVTKVITNESVEYPIKFLSIQTTDMNYIENLKNSKILQQLSGL
jgi:hypothetical protein